MAAALKTALQPGDQVASFHTYYQDLPVYLQRPIEIIGWRGELQFRRTVSQDSGGWMIDEKTFWRQWRGPQRVYAITDRATYASIAKKPPAPLNIVTEDDYDVLLTNREPVPGALAHAGRAPRFHGAGIRPPLS